MKIIIVKQYNPLIGWNIYIEDIKEREIEAIISLIKKLGFKRNIQLEKESNESGGNNLLKKAMLRRTYTKKDSYFSFDYYRPTKDVAIIWCDKIMDGGEFLSLIFSNLKTKKPYPCLRDRA